MKRFVVGDIHGAYLAWQQCAERSGFNKQTDLLINLGDLCDGWPDGFQVVEAMLGITHLVLIKGNHDAWLMAWFKTGETSDNWLEQGGRATLQSYHTIVPDTHRQLLHHAVNYHVMDDMLFVHGGYHTKVPIAEQEADFLTWDRSLVELALMHRHFKDDFQLTSYKKVFVGHTPTVAYSSTQPIEACGVVMMDTGAGFADGRLTIMDIDSGSYWQSDPVNTLYPGFRGR